MAFSQEALGMALSQSTALRHRSFPSFGSLLQINCSFSILIPAWEDRIEVFGSPLLAMNFYKIKRNSLVIKSKFFIYCDL